jgi:hypothetical protein
MKRSHSPDPTLRAGRRALIPPALALIMLAIAALACNLSDSGAPPTLVARPTSTPPPTIGYAPLSPNELPSAATYIAPAVGDDPAISAPDSPRSDIALLNLMNQVESAKLMGHVQSLQDMGTRHVNSGYGLVGRGIGGAYDYIESQFETIRDESRGNFVVLPPHEFPVAFEGVTSTARNVIGVLQGTETGAGIILIGAHYDSITINFADSVAFAPGANDNASGVAALIEIARIMSQRPHRATVMFVAFSAEEVGRKGSQAFITDYLVPYGIRIDAMINMDIIGSSTGVDGALDDRRIRLYSAEPNESPSRQLARALNLIAFQHVPGMEIDIQSTGDREGRYSDHLSFSDAGFPAVRFIEQIENPNRNHNNADTVDGIRPQYLLRATQTILASATVLADGLRPPSNISLRAEGGGLRTLLWERVPGARSYIVALRRPGSMRYDEQFETGETSAVWDQFTADRWAGLAIAAKDSQGMMGPLSDEYPIGS